MSTLAKSTREQYLGDWRERKVHCDLRGLSPWICTTDDNWDVKILDYLIWLGEMSKCSAATMRRKMSAIRYIHLATGLADFSRVGIRYKMSVKAYAAKRPTSRKLPFNVDLLKWTHDQLNKHPQVSANAEVWGAMVLSFFFCMRTSEMRNLRHCDIILGEKGGEAVITIFFQKSKTDQTAIGRFRSLCKTHSFLCPIAAVIPWIREINWGPKGRKRCSAMIFRCDLLCSRSGLWRPTDCPRRGLQHIHSGRGALPQCLWRGSVFTTLSGSDVGLPIR